MVKCLYPRELPFTYANFQYFCLGKWMIGLQAEHAAGRTFKLQTFTDDVNTI